MPSRAIVTALVTSALIFLCVSTTTYAAVGDGKAMAATTSAPTPGGVAETRLDNPNYFEGDLDIPQAVINAYYEDLNMTEPGQCTINGIRNRDILWPNGIVHYDFHSSIENSTRAVVLEAIEELEEKTCLQFQESPTNDRIVFTGEGDGCTSSSVGKSQGKQFVRLPSSSGSTCATKGIALHLVCHALGLWHEQSRPDRDEYVEIVEENVKTDNLRHFGKRIAYGSDFYGQMYDYDSIMHYGTDYFSQDGSDTLKVANVIEYNCQGQPIVGQRSRLSDGDVTKLNQMYKCPGSGYGVSGYLKVHVRRGVALTNQPASNAPYQYVKVAAVDDMGRRAVYYTTALRTAPDAEWNQWLDFGERKFWQYLELSVWTYNRWSSNVQTFSNQTFTLSQGYHRNLRYCDGQSCTPRVYFDYDIKPDANDCIPDPCVRGTCTDRFFAHLCNCPHGYSGLNCEIVRGDLRVYIRHGSGLPNMEFTAGSDPYVYVDAYNVNGDQTSLSTRVEKNTLNPAWNQWLNFGVDSWSRLSVTVYEHNSYSSRLMSNTTSYYFPDHKSDKNVRKYCNSGFIELDYYFQP